MPDAKSSPVPRQHLGPSLHAGSQLPALRAGTLQRDRLLRRLEQTADVPLALSSRREPALPIGRLRADGRLVDVRQPDLVMTRPEAAAMLSLAGLALSGDDVLLLLERTEGWPAGLYLAALSLQGRQDPHR